MAVLYYLAGGAIVLLATVDLIWTTLWVDGGTGPLSKPLARGTWWLTKSLSRGNKHIFSLVGPLILVLTITSWAVLLWVGLTLFFAGNPESIVQTTFEGPITWYERFYFTGFTLFTLGVGDYSPQPGFWQIVTAFNSGLGIMLLTLGASYVISVVGAVVNKRAFARTVTGLGLTSSDLVKLAWDGNDLYQLDLILMDLSSKITELCQQHQAYPLLHFYHSKKMTESSALAVAILDETLSVIEWGVGDATLYNTVLVKDARSSIESYLGTLTAAFIEEANTEPERPDLNDIKAKGIPFVSQDVFKDRLDQAAPRRRKLLGAVQADCHSWPCGDQ